MEKKGQGKRWASPDGTKSKMNNDYSTFETLISPVANRHVTLDTEQESIKIKKFRKNLLASNKFLPKKALKALQCDINFGEIAEVTDSVLN